MKQMLNTVARLLAEAARVRAEQVAQTQAQTPADTVEAHRSNAGGWN